MDLVDLILTVCLVTNPANCHDEHLYFERRGGLMQCTMLAPPEIAKWSEQHPKHKVMRWKCAFPEQGKAI